MLEAEKNPHPIQLLVNYWEIRPSLMGAHLDDLIRRGIRNISAFVPWQAVESDISHTLTRFLQAVLERKMALCLLVSPEVGVHYPNSGIPKDVVGRQDHLAQHVHREGVVTNLPPNSFRLPSLLSPEFTKRYYSFLTRIDNLLGDFEKTNGKAGAGITVIVSGSLWKYYRSPRSSFKRAFGGPAGDYAGGAAVAYRQCLEQYYSQREFLDPTPAAANRWKSMALDEINRRWFYQQSEDVFRNRTLQFIRRKSNGFPLREIELFTPEADPGMSYSNFLQTISGGNADFFRLSSLVDEAASRASLAGHAQSLPFIHWTSVGGFKTLADSEKQFLILKSLLLMGGRGGGVFIDESEWSSLSQAFRMKAEALAQQFAHGDLKLKIRAQYLVPHLWSSGSGLWDELFSKLGPSAQMVASTELCLKEPNAKLLVVDPACIITRDLMTKLIHLAEAGRTVIIPRSQLYTESAKSELEAIGAKNRGLEINFGVPYRLQAVGKGKLAVFELPPDLPLTAGDTGPTELLPSWKTFLTAILSVAEVGGTCQFDDKRVKVIPLERKKKGTGLFLLNGSRRPTTAEIAFPVAVAVSDFASALATSQMGQKVETTYVNRFALEIPPCGVLPLAIEEAPAAIAAKPRAPQVEPTRETSGLESLWN